MDQTMGNRMAQQQMMSTRRNTSHQVNQSRSAGLSSSMTMIAMLANTCIGNMFEHEARARGKNARAPQLHAPLPCFSPCLHAHLQRDDEHEDALLAITQEGLQATTAAEPGTGKLTHGALMIK